MQVYICSKKYDINMWKEKINQNESFFEKFIFEKIT